MRNDYCAQVSSRYVAASTPWPQAPDVVAARKQQTGIYSRKARDLSRSTFQGGCKSVANSVHPGLFDEADTGRSLEFTGGAPLADRMRPTTLA